MLPHSILVEEKNNSDKKNLANWLLTSPNQKRNFVGKKAKANHIHYTSESRAVCLAASPWAEYLFASWDTMHIKDYTNTAMTSTSSKLQIEHSLSDTIILPYQTAVLTRISLDTDLHLLKCLPWWL